MILEITWSVIMTLKIDVKLMILQTYMVESDS